MTRAWLARWDNTVKWTDECGIIEPYTPSPHRYQELFLQCP